MPVYKTTYITKDGDREMSVPVDEVTMEECPMSVIARMPEMDMLAQEVLCIHGMRESTGAVPFGPDAAKWPVRWYDAVRLAGIEDFKIDQARDAMGKTLR